ncbi:trypsin-like peptidase domain-containing protein [Streptomyces lavendulae]|uniref:trypsin-like peptidase domain-containing protein n=1 Tax=Streptomyces lavendulae TaxID=1914 RepID=UPI0031EB87C0
MKTVSSSSRRWPAAVALSGLIAAGLLTGGLISQASYFWGDGFAKPSVSTKAPLIDSASADGKRFRASGRLLGGAGGGTNCTATVVSAPHPIASARALVLTNGHCVRDTLKTNEVAIGEPAPQNWSFTPAYFHDNPTEHQTFPVERVAYATMKDTDIAVLELGATYRDLAKLKVVPRIVSADKPTAGQALRAAHAPVIGVSPGEQFLRLSTCRAKAAAVATHEYTWLWKGTTRTDCLGISGGSSGGIVTTEDGDRLVALINTVATPGYLGCGLGRPCEGTATGLVIPRDDTVYAVPVDRVASCLDPTGLRLDKQGCLLDLGQQVDVAFSGRETQSQTPGGPARWDAHVRPATTLQQKYAAFKTGPFGVVDCTDPVGYSRPQPLPAAGLDVTDVLPTPDRLYVLCAAGGPNAESETWKNSFQYPAYAFARVDNASPTVAPKLDIAEFEDEYRVRPEFLLWEITYYEIKYGPRATTDCDNGDGYVPYRRVPISLPKSGAPWTVCLIGYDNADNTTSPTALPVPSGGVRSARGLLRLLTPGGTAAASR